MSAIGTRRRAAQGRTDLPMNAEINVTSLVDVAFTLLVIFMITAPIMQGGIELAMPRADVRPLTSQDAPFFISMTADGQIFMEETPVTLQQLEAGLAQVLSGGTVERVFIRGDSLAVYGPVLKAMVITFDSGLPVSLVAEPYVEGS